MFWLIIGAYALSVLMFIYYTCLYYVSRDLHRRVSRLEEQVNPDAD
jgi:hypothetical protein